MTNRSKQFVKDRFNYLFLTGLILVAIARISGRHRRMGIRPMAGFVCAAWLSKLA
jgi:hypothetical protein